MLFSEIKFYKSEKPRRLDKDHLIDEDHLTEEELAPPLTLSDSGSGIQALKEAQPFLKLWRLLRNNFAIQIVSEKKVWLTSQCDIAKVIIASRCWIAADWIAP